MLSRLILAGVLAAAASAQTMPTQIEVANLREDVRGLTQRMGELVLRVEQLERENAELRTKLAGTQKSFVTVSQLNDSITELTRSLEAAVKGAKTETLEHVAAQMGILAKQTNAALDSLAKVQATRPAVQTAFSDDYPKEGLKYTVQPGDTLSVIAKKTGAKQQDIINANKLTDPSKIAAGQTLFIPNANPGAK